MLQFLSDGAKSGISKLILVGLLFFAVAGLVLTDVGGFFRDGVSSTDVAKVGSESISYSEFDRHVRRTLSPQGITPEKAYQFGLIHQILQSYVQESMLVQHAHDLGIYIPDSKVAAELHDFIAPYQSPGISAQQALNQFLADRQTTEGEFVNRLKRSMTIDLLQESILAGTTIIPEELVNIEARFANETRDVHILSLSNSDVRVPNPTDEEISAYYEETKEQYAIPERRTFTLAIFDPKTLDQTATPDDKSVQEYYETNIHLYDNATRRDASIALVNSKEKADRIIADLESGKALKAVTPSTNYEFKQDATASDFMPIIANAVFAEEDNTGNVSYPKIKGPIETPLGWYVIELNSPVKEGPVPFEQVKDEIRKSMLEDMQSNAVFETVDILDESVDDGVPFDEIVKEYQLKTLQIGHVDQAGIAENSNTRLSQFKSSAQTIIQSAFYLNEGEISPVEELNDGRFALIRLDSVIPTTYKPLDKVHATIKERLVTLAKQAKNAERAQTIHKKLLEDGITLQEAAHQLQIPIRTLRNVKRDLGEKEPPAPLLPMLHQTLFSTETDQPILAPIENGIAIAYSSNQHIPQSADIPEAAKADIEKSSHQQLANALIKTYLADVTEAKQVRINQKLIEQLYGLDEGLQ